MVLTDRYYQPLEIEGLIHTPHTSQSKHKTTAVSSKSGLCKHNHTNVVTSPWAAQVTKQPQLQYQLISTPMSASPLRPAHHTTDHGLFSKCTKCYIAYIYVCRVCGWVGCFVMGTLLTKITNPNAM